MRSRVLAVATAGLILAGVPACATGRPTAAPANPATVRTSSQTPSVTTKTVTETEPVPFGKSTVDDPALDKGTTAVRTAGVDGVRTRTYEVTLTDGAETGRRLVSDTVTTPPVTEVTAVGTRVAAPKPAPSSPLRSPARPAIRTTPAPASRSPATSTAWAAPATVRRTCEARSMSSAPTSTASTTTTTESAASRPGRVWSAMVRTRRVLPVVLLGIVVLALVLSGIRPYSRLTWSLETVWIFVGVPIVLLTWRRFPLTDLLCVLLAVHALILIVGGLYTYARVPFGFWLQDALDLSRNPYDRIGHFAQGFVPAILVREILVRRSPLRGSRWLAPLVVSVCLAFSAFFELIEWWTAVAGGSAADDFLATQGDVWDTQWDMFLALLGAITSLLVLSRFHDRQLSKVEDQV